MAASNLIASNQYYPYAKPFGQQRGQIHFGTNRSVDASRFFRPDKYRAGGKLTIRPLSPLRYARLENGQIIRRGR